MNPSHIKILKQLEYLKLHNNKYIHRIEDTFGIYLSDVIMKEYYNSLIKNPCEKCDKNIPCNIEEKHPSLWKFKGCSCDYYKIALSNTYRETYLKIELNY
jgi:hypothetical protein